MEKLWCSYCGIDREMRHEEYFIRCIDCGNVTDAEGIMNADMYAAKIRLAAELYFSENSEEQSTLDNTDAKQSESDPESDSMDTDNKNLENKRRDNSGEVTCGADVYYGSEEEEDDEEYGPDGYDGSEGDDEKEYGSGDECDHNL